jgi:hypothetical protein
VYVLSSQLLPSGEPQVLLFILDLWYVKVLQWERFCCLRHCSALLGWSQWECSSWTSSVVERQLFSTETTVGANVGGSENQMESPNTRVANKSTQITKKEGIKNLRKSVLASKVVNPFICALTPPFIGRRKDFYITRLSSNLKNIRNVNMYMNVFYIPWFVELISYIYKPATSSHFKPGLFETTSLTRLPWASEISFTKVITHRDSRTEVSENFQVDGFMRFTTFQSSRNKQQNYEPKPSSVINLWNIQKVSNLRSIQQNVFHEHHLATNLEFPIIAILTNIFMNSVTPIVSRVKGFCPIPQHCCLFLYLIVYIQCSSISLDIRHCLPWIWYPWNTLFPVEMLQ